MSAIKSRACTTNQPEFGPRLATNGKWRVVVGWKHQNDTTEGIRSGKIWCWVPSDGRRFQVYDENFNRGADGEVRFCGVANFTMVRMFHPFWCTPRIPQDGVWEDKKRCRELYMALEREHRERLGLPVNETSEENVAEQAQAEEAEQAKEQELAKVKEAAEPRNITGFGKPRDGHASKGLQSLADLPPEENIPGSHLTDPFILDDGHSNDDSNGSDQCHCTRVQNCLSQNYELGTGPRKRLPRDTIPQQYRNNGWLAKISSDLDDDNYIERNTPGDNHEGHDDSEMASAELLTGDSSKVQSSNTSYPRNIHGRWPSAPSRVTKQESPFQTVPAKRSASGTDLPDHRATYKPYADVEERQNRGIRVASKTPKIEESDSLFFSETRTINCNDDGEGYSADTGQDSDFSEPLN